MKSDYYNNDNVDYDLKKIVELKPVSGQPRNSGNRVVKCHGYGGYIRAKIWATLSGNPQSVSKAILLLGITTVVK